MTAAKAPERLATWLWRPAIGFAVAFAVLSGAALPIVCYIGAIWYGRSDLLEHLPATLAAEAGLIAVVSPVIGIASYFRGKKQLGDT